MKKIKIICPIKNLKDIDLIEKTSCKNVYVSHCKFLKDNYNLVFDYLNKAKEHNIKLLINFNNILKEEDIENVRDFLKFLSDKNINGILVNDIAILEILKDFKMPFSVFIDSGLNIHNLAGIEFISQYHQIENINLTEEIYINNIIKIKKYSKQQLSIDADNFPWIAEEVINSKTIDAVIIKGKFETSKKLIEGIQLIEKIIETPKDFKKQKMSFKNPDNLFYKTNHFSGEFLNTEGKNFKFSSNIKTFNWNFSKARLIQKPSQWENFPRLNLKFTSLEQISILKKYIKKLKFNPVYSIEYGEVLNNCDLSKHSFNKILAKVKKYCEENDIKLQLSTPRILSERDFDRVYEYVKQLCVTQPYPDSIIVNNLGYWSTIIHDNDINNIPIELGQGLNLINSLSILSLAKQYKNSTVDLSNFKDINNMKTCIKKVSPFIPNIKLTIGGNIRIPSHGLCPLNNDSAILSRLSCPAPCHKGTFALFEPKTEKVFPFAVDGFCRMHLFKDKILDLFTYVELFKNIGINEFSIDFSGLPASIVPILLNRFINSNTEEYTPETNFLTNIYNIS